MIKPTVGRVLLYWPNGVHRETDDQPWVGLVAHVYSDRCVNLALFDSTGTHVGGRTSVVLVQPQDETPASGPFCEWMPYQKQVAAGHVAPVQHAAPAG